MTNDQWIEIGTIVAPQGLDGEVRVFPDSDFPERFLEPGTRYLKRPGQSEPTAIELLSGRVVPGKGLYVLELEGIEDRDQAEALRDAKLFVPISDRPALEEDEFHVVDLIDLEVFHHQTQDAIGIVVDVLPAGNDLLEVKLHKQPEPVQPKEVTPPNRKSKISKLKRVNHKPVTVLIPFVKEIVPLVDLINRRIEVNPPEGLLEPNTGLTEESS